MTLLSAACRTADMSHVLDACAKNMSAHPALALVNQTAPQGIFGSFPDSTENSESAVVLILFFLAVLFLGLLWLCMLLYVLSQSTLVHLRRVNCMYALLHAGGKWDPRLNRGAGY